MADFRIAHEKTSKVERGYQCDEDDNGNWTGGIKGVGHLVGTKDGIAASTLKDFLGRNPTVDEMKQLDQYIVEQIYRKNYWNEIKGDQIINQEQANQIYDSAVNMGVGTAIILAKRAAGLSENSQMSSDLLDFLNNA